MFPMENLFSMGYLFPIIIAKSLVHEKDLCYTIQKRILKLNNKLRKYSERDG